MNKLTGYILTLIISLSFFALSGTLKNSNAENANLIPNYSFELGNDEPTGWEKSSKSSCNDNEWIPDLSLQWSNLYTKTGSKALSLEYQSITQSYMPYGYWITSNFTPVRYNPGFYKLEGWIYSNSTRLIPYFLICRYNWDGSYRDLSRMTNYSPVPPGWTKLEFSGPNFVGEEKIKIGLGVLCQPVPGGNPCEGTLAFDDVSLRPRNAIVAHKFEDSNKNSSFDTDEKSLPDWEMELFYDQNCEGPQRSTTWTRDNGNIIFVSWVQLAPGNYSVRETFRTINRDGPNPFPINANEIGWTNTTPVCQNVTLNPGETPIVHFGNIRGPTVPYFSQLDPQWSAKEYDHGNSIGPFFCGTTIGGCGCAITSSAMLLKYHGATKSPDGAETNPDTLNTWLKNNHGYAFGALKWNSIAAYSVKANQNYQTQKIRFAGVGSGNNYTLLDSELANNNPTILEQPGHFILSTGKQSPTYNINDPAYENRKTLQSYSNSFGSMRRFEKTNSDLSAIYLSTPTPNDLFIKDSLGRRSGKDPQTGQIFTEIPNSFYFLEPELADQTQENSPLPPENSGVNMLVILRPEQGSYNFSTGSGDVDVSFYDQNGEISQKEFKADSPKTLNINYSPIPGELNNFFQEIKIDVIPTSTQNRIYPKSGNLEVLVKKTAQFNPALFDIPTAILGNAQAHSYKSKNGKNGLSLYFKVRDLNLSESDRILCLQGVDKNGIPVKGCDFVKVHR